MSIVTHLSICNGSLHYLSLIQKKISLHLLKAFLKANVDCLAGELNRAFKKMVSLTNDRSKRIQSYSQFEKHLYNFVTINVHLRKNILIIKRIYLSLT